MDGRTKPLAFRGHVVVGGVLECRTGLHVGGNRDSLVIGGLDLPVARDPATRMPIVPGSSLKGRLRVLLEMLRGKSRRGGDGADAGPDAIDLLFGQRAARSTFGPTRLLVRDAQPLEGGRNDRAAEKSTAQWWRMLETDGLGTEVKAEAAINRVTAAAEVRQVERVLAGSRFQIEFVLSVFDFWPDEERLLKDLLTALALLEDSYLGGHGTRGYGRVAIHLFEQPGVSTRKDYDGGRRRHDPAGELVPLARLDVDAFVAAVGEKLKAGDA